MCLLKVARLTTRKSKAYRKHYYLANQTKGLLEKKSNYQQNADSRRRADKQTYEVNFEKKRYARRRYYTSKAGEVQALKRIKYDCNPEPEKLLARLRCSAKPEPHKQAVRLRYREHPEPHKQAVRLRYKKNADQKKRAQKLIYASNPLLKKLAVQKQYRKQRSVILQKRKSHYYASLKCRRAARLLRYAMHRSSKNAKNKLYRQVNKKTGIATCAVNSNGYQLRLRSKCCVHCQLRVSRVAQDRSLVKRTSGYKACCSELLLS